MEDIIRISCYISMLLRHKPEAAGLTLDEHGWAEVDKLLEGVSRHKHPLTMEELEFIVDTDDKKRYSFSEDKALIRANQGHSVPVDVELKECAPPDILWHGTGEKYVESIDRIGLIPKSRLYVHLSSDCRTAAEVGRRHGKSVVYQLDAAGMHRDGYSFYLSENGVWLTKEAPVKYLIKYSEE